MADRHLYEAFMKLGKELRKVSNGRGDEAKLGDAIDEAFDQGLEKEAIAAIVESAGAAADYAASQCKECAGHARTAAKNTLRAYMPDPPAPKPKPKPRGKGKGKGAAPSLPAAESLPREYPESKRGGACAKCGRTLLGPDVIFCPKCARDLLTKGPMRPLDKPEPAPAFEWKHCATCKMERKFDLPSGGGRPQCRACGMPFGIYRESGKVFDFADRGPAA